MISRRSPPGGRHRAPSLSSYGRAGGCRTDVAQHGDAAEGWHGAPCMEDGYRKKGGPWAGAINAEGNANCD